MQLRRPFRRTALSAVLFVLGAGAFGATRQALDLDRRRVTPVGDGGSAAASTGGLDDAQLRRRRGELRTRRFLAEEASQSADAAAAIAALSNPASSASLQPSSKLVDLRVLPSTAQTRMDLADFALRAAPADDPTTGEATLVAPGRPPELALAAFVASGGTVDRAAEIVGERRPSVDEGVPVSLTGRVVEAEDGTPIEGASVLVWSTFYVRRYFYDHHLQEVARVATDAEGAYLVERLNTDPAHFGSSGRLYLTVTAPGHAPSLAVPLATVTRGVANRLPAVALQRATETLRGRVVDHFERRPVVGARVFATGAIDPVAYPKDERPALFLGAPTATTDADGRFVLEGLGRGVQMVSVHAGDDCTGRALVSLPSADELTISSQPVHGRVEGTILDERGAPVALVKVDCGDNSTHSFADGRFVLENFRGDTVTIDFTHPDYAPAVLRDVRDGAAGVVVHMERPRSRIVLEVRDADTSAPVARVELELKYDAGRAPPEGTSPHRLADDGRYELRVPEGAAGVSVSAAGRRSELVTLSGRADGETVTVLLAQVDR